MSRFRSLISPSTHNIKFSYIQRRYYINITCCWSSTPLQIYILHCHIGNASLHALKSITHHKKIFSMHIRCHNLAITDIYTMQFFWRKTIENWVLQRQNSSLLPLFRRITKQNESPYKSRLAISHRYVTLWDVPLLHGGTSHQYICTMGRPIVCMVGRPTVYESRVNQKRRFQGGTLVSSTSVSSTSHGRSDVILLHVLPNW